jgi:2-oxoglutarate dehydrogenase E1 component
MNRQFRKPLIIFFSKSLLRHPLARSDIEDFTGDSHFQWLIPDPEHGNTIKAPEECKRLLICTGQVYAALHKHRASNNIDDVAIARVEQLHPFPWAQLRDELEKFPNAQEVIWTQEEPLNAGAWSHVQPRMETVLRQSSKHADKHIRYAGRAPSASVATGLKASHIKEEQDLLNQALGLTELQG